MQRARRPFQRNRPCCSAISPVAAQLALLQRNQPYCSAIGHIAARLAPALPGAGGQASRGRRSLLQRSGYQLRIAIVLLQRNGPDCRTASASHCRGARVIPRNGPLLQRNTGRPSLLQHTKPVPQRNKPQSSAFPLNRLGRERERERELSRQAPYCTTTDPIAAQ